jgi:hypothetical protein
MSRFLIADLALLSVGLMAVVALAILERRRTRAGALQVST